MLRLLFVLLSLAGTVALANRVNNGGEQVAGEFTRLAHVVLNALERLPHSEQILTVADLDRLERAIAEVRVNAVPGPLRDNSGRLVNARVLMASEFRDTVIEIDEARWIAAMEARRPLARLVLHEYLRVLGHDDDNYRISARLPENFAPVREIGSFESYCSLQDLNEPELESVQFLLENVLGATERSPANCRRLAASLPAVTELDLDVTRTPDLNFLRRMPWLVSLSIAGTCQRPMLPRLSLEPLAGLNGLRELSLVCLGVRTLEPLSTLTALETLLAARVVPVGRTSHDLAPLSALATLERFQWTSGGLQDIGPLRHLSRLRRVDVYNNAIQDFSPLDDLPSLEALVADGNPGWKTP